MYKLILVILLVSGCSFNPITNTFKDGSKSRATTTADALAKDGQWIECCAITRGSIWRIYPTEEDRQRLDNFCAPIMSICVAK